MKTYNITVTDGGKIFINGNFHPCDYKMDTENEEVDLDKKILLALANEMEYEAKALFEEMANRLDDIVDEICDKIIDEEKEENKMKLNVGDSVYINGCGIRGKIVEMFDDYAYVEYSAGGGGGTMPCEYETLILIPEQEATLRAFKSPHGTINVVVQNCSSEVNTLLWRFDIWKSGGRFKYDESKPWERAEIWFECPAEFLEFIESSMGRACFERMGVEKFIIEH